MGSLRGFLYCARLHTDFRQGLCMGFLKLARVEGTLPEGFYGSASSTLNPVEGPGTLEEEQSTDSIGG